MLPESNIAIYTRSVSSRSRSNSNNNNSNNNTHNTNEKTSPPTHGFQFTTRLHPSTASFPLQTPVALSKPASGLLLIVDRGGAPQREDPRPLPLPLLRPGTITTKSPGPLPISSTLPRTRHRRRAAPGSLRRRQGPHCYPRRPNWLTAAGALPATNQWTRPATARRLRRRQWEGTGAPA
jgi:hypothetical protein